jgi:hypothetical protein
MKKLHIAGLARPGVLPPARPVLWSLRPMASADVTDEVLGTGQRRITIRHAPLHGVTPEMLSWWYGGNIVGTMSYGGQRWPRYLVWHPLDHISYEILGAQDGGPVGPGTRIRVREAFQRDPRNILDVTVEVVKLDDTRAIIARRVPGGHVLRLTNEFAPVAQGTVYMSQMEIGAPSLLGRLGLNHLIRRRILPGSGALAWARHHIEEIGNLENFLPRLWEADGGLRTARGPAES